MKTIIIFFISFCCISHTNAQLYINGDVIIQNSGLLYANDTIQLGSQATISTNGNLQSTKAIKTNGVYVNTSKTGFVICPVANSIATNFDIGTNGNNKLQLQHTTGSAVTFKMAVRDSVYTNPSTNTTKITANIVNKTWVVEPLSAATNATATLYWNAANEAMPFYRNSCFFSKWDGTNWANIGLPKAAINTGSNPTYNKTALVGNLTANQNYFSVQGNSPSSISGVCRHPLGSLIKNVNVSINGDSNYSKLLSTGFQESLFNYGNYTLRPSKNNDIAKNNGVSAIDVILTQNHILSKIKLNSPYKIIAADVNNNKTVTNIDIIFMKRLILGIDTTFTGNRLWAFVDSSYAFPDTTNPFPYKDSINFTNLTSSKTNQTFIGLKLGDVNYDWNSATPRGTAVNSLELIVKSVEQLTNNNLQLTISTSNFKNLVGLQYTLHFDNSKYEFVGITNNKLGIEYNAQQAATTGNISFVWTDAKAEERSLEDGSLLFELILNKVHRPSTIDNSVNDGLSSINYGLVLNNSIADIEAWDKDFNKHQIILKQTTQQQQETPNTKQEFSVSPNPTSGDVKLSVETKSNKTVVFELTNIYGKTLLQQSFEAVKGDNVFSINLNKNGKLATGIYFLKAIGLEGENVKRIIVK